MSTATTTAVPISDDNVCRLCQVNCVGKFKCINGENSEMDEIYKITVKYFPVKFLGPCWRNTSAALCLECWRHIIEFHTFQETIFDIQKRLLGRQHEGEITMKDENIFHTNNLVDVKPNLWSTPVSDITLKTEVPSDDNCQNKEEYILDISLSDLEDIDIQFSTDDEMSVSSSMDTRTKVEIKTPLQNPTQNTPQCNVFQDSQTCDGTGKKSIDHTEVKDIEKDKCNPKLRCWICSKTVSTFDLLQKHFALYHRRGQCYITCCQVKITSKQELVDHTSFNQTRKESFMCEICKIEYPRASILKKHTLQRHAPTAKAQHFECPECPELFMTSAELEKHYESHFVCHKCSKIFQTTDGLKSHTLMVHNTTKKSVSPAASLESFTCEKCGKTMKSKGSFETHQRFAHMYDKTYNCNFCEKAFKKVLQYRDHMNNHSKDNFYACPHCSNKYPHWALLESHMNLKHANKCTPKHMSQLMLAEEARVVIVKNAKNSPSKTNGNIKTNAATKTLQKNKEKHGKFKKPIKK